MWKKASDLEMNTVVAFYNHNAFLNAITMNHFCYVETNLEKSA